MLGQPSKIEHVDQEEIAANIAAVPDALRARSAGKASRGYDPAWNLAIFLNVATYGCERDEIDECFEAATQPAAGAYAAVWVQWGRDACRTWLQGGPRPPHQVDEPPDFHVSEIFDLSEIFDGR